MKTKTPKDKHNIEDDFNFEDFDESQLSLIEEQENEEDKEDLKEDYKNYATDDSVKAYLQQIGKIPLLSHEEEMEIGGRALWLCLSGEIGVDITDESFTHDFGTEYRTGYELTGLESVGEAQAYDAETDERVKLLFDYRLFTRKVNALCN